MLGAIITSLALGALTKEVEVWDSVINAQSCTKLHNYASHHGLSHNIFHRKPGPDEQREGELSILEEAIDSILTELNDEATVVEYWCRQEWKKIEAHSDVDERLAIEEQVYMHPRNGHVLYLQVGSDVRGPTCLFLDCKFGGDLLKQKENNIDLITVPAVEGRLLRFEGSLLHAVPRPADLWLLPFTSLGPTDPEHIWGRSVVLFNTWPDDPPKGIKTVQSKSEMENNNDVKCNSLSSWEKMPIEEIKPSENNKDDKLLSKCKIWLLGDGPRRDYPGRTINLKAPLDLKDALEKSRQPIFSQLEC